MHWAPRLLVYKNTASPSLLLLLILCDTQGTPPSRKQKELPEVCWCRNNKIFNKQQLSKIKTNISSVSNAAFAWVTRPECPKGEVKPTGPLTSSNVVRYGEEQTWTNPLKLKIEQVLQIREKRKAKHNPTPSQCSKITLTNLTFEEQE